MPFSPWKPAVSPTVGQVASLRLLKNLPSEAFSFRQAGRMEDAVFGSMYQGAMFVPFLSHQHVGNPQFGALLKFYEPTNFRFSVMFPWFCINIYIYIYLLDIWFVFVCRGRKQMEEKRTLRPKVPGTPAAGKLLLGGFDC